MSEDFFLFFGIFFVFVRLLGLRGRAGEREGRAGEREGRREGGGWIFPRTNSLTFLTDFPQENVPYLKENVRYLAFPKKTTVLLHFGRTSCHLPRFPDENLRYLGCCCCCWCCPEKTDVALVVVVVVVVAVVVVLLLLLNFSSPCGCC